MKLLLALAFALLPVHAFAQQASPKPVKKTAAAAPEKHDAEEADLEQALAEAGGSPVEYARALERHLAKYPNTQRRAEIERVLVQSAIEAKDRRRLLLFGVPLVEAGNRNLTTLDHVGRALLDSTKTEDQQRALKYARILEEELNKSLVFLNDPSAESVNRGRRLSEAEKALCRAYAFQARAQGNLGEVKQAVELASKAWALYPSDEAGRELARWLERDGDLKGAVNALAAADAASEAPADDAARRKDRARMSELAAKANLSDSDLGLAFLRASDSVAAQLTARRERLKKVDPNAFATRISDFTLSALTGRPLDLESLKGKVVVLDFWATWCGPCRAQYPLYQQTKQRFKDSGDVVFVAVSTDEERSVVEPFLDSNKWSKQVYFEDGLATLLRVSSIPTTIVLNKRGEVYSRMHGFIRDRFVDMLSDRINEALQQN